MVLTGNSNVHNDILEEAQKRGISMLRTSLDSGTTIRRLKLSAPITRSINSSAVQFSQKQRRKKIHNEVISSYNHLFPVVDEQNKLIGIFNKSDLEREPRTHLIMVDHNELAHAISGAEELTVLEIIDHHRLGLSPTLSPIMVRNDIVGSTCTLVVELYQQFGIQIEKGIAGILMGGIVSDTVGLRSATTTQRDIEAVALLQGICHINPRKLKQEFFNIGSLIATKTAKEVISLDLKAYQAGDYAIAIAQVEEVGFSSFEKNIDILEKALKEKLHDENFDFISLLVTDIIHENSQLLVAGKSELVKQLPFMKITETVYDLPHVMSRKKQLLPRLIKLFTTI
jgi:manganese-dependent inorganic pyrophosphatase